VAKISARGDAEACRWRRESDGAELPLTHNGRLLHKAARGASFRLLMERTSQGVAEAHATERGMERLRTAK
jgi:hypothetical protein